MKIRLLVAVMLLTAMLAGCTPTMYGVPEATWQQMSEPERVAAIEAYRQRQIVMQQAQAERARQRAIAEEAERRRQAAEEQQRQLFIDAIYRGEGVYGDLLQVTLSDGMINFSGKHRTYPPVSFRIAQGETRDIAVLDDKGRRREVRVSYLDGTLVLDQRGAKPNQVARFSYDPDWEYGISFPPVETKGNAELRGVKVAIDVLGEPPHRHRPPRVSNPPRQTPQPPQVIVVQQPAPPPQVIVIEQPQARPPHTGNRSEHWRPEAQRPQPQQPAVAAPAPSPPTPPATVSRNQPSPWQRNPPGVQPRPPVRGQEPQTAPVATRQPPAPPTPPQHLPRAEAPGQAGPQAPAATIQEQVPQQIRVAFLSGKIKVKGKYHPLTPIEVLLSEGESLNLSLQSAGGGIEVGLSYLAGELVIDSEPGQGPRNRGQQRLNAGKDWQRGRRYRFDSPGKQLLRQIELEVAGTHSG